MPLGVRYSYGVEDMVQDVVTRVVRYAQSYDPARARESTWVCTVAQNTCKSILFHHTRRKKYTNCQTVELTPFMAASLPAPATRVQVDEARNAVERLIEYGSDEVRDLIEAIFDGRPAHPTQEVITEFRTKAARYAVCLSDFELVLKHCVS